MQMFKLVVVMWVQRERHKVGIVFHSASNCFSGALVTYVKGLTCLNRETQSQMTFHSKHLLK